MSAGKWVRLIAFMAPVALSSACFSQDDRAPVEWVQRPEAIVILVHTADDFEGYEAELDTPDYVLYGDGRLLVNGAEGLRETRVSEADIRGLLEYFVDEGFIEFSYEQPENLSVIGGGTTFVYLNARTQANAVSAYALGFEAPEGNEWDDFRDLQAILGKVGEVSYKYSPEMTNYPSGWTLIVASRGMRENAVDRPQQWTHDNIDLAEIAQSESGRMIVAGDLRVNLPGPRSYLYEQNGELFRVGVRPILPHEEYFPEFDVPR